MVAGVGSRFIDRRSRRVGEPIFSQKKLAGPPDLDAAPDAMAGWERLREILPLGLCAAFQEHASLMAVELPVPGL